MALSKYFAYFVDLQGTARASYELQAIGDDAAKIEGGYFLKFHPSIEVWQGARYVARLMREEPVRVQGH
jgi:hypothetical protein